ncbi:MAG TPA: sigma-70 family RNA polymerase sigma factor [Gemmataceae bacterium]|nr:sigma-70 family RNA polymerase sigma factor [Gemmataceae bacterium]
MAEWPELLQEHGPSAWRAAYRIVGNRADADDCLQEACLAAFAYSRRNQIQDWRGLLVHLATARAVDRLRSRRRHAVGHYADWETIPGRTRSPSERVEDAERADQLRAALARLAPTQAEVFCLHCLEEWSYDEIARHLSTSTDAVGVHLHRARKRLRVLLAEFLEVPPGPHGEGMGNSENRS